MAINQKIFWMWALPLEKDSNKHIRHYIVSEFEWCKNVDVTFLQASDYQKILKLDLNESIVVVFGSFFNPEFDIYSLVHSIKSQSISTTTVVWLTDDPYEFDRNFHLPHVFDLVITNDESSRYYYYADNVKHLALAAAYHDVDKIENSTVQEKEWDLVFCGVGFPNRNRIIEGLNPILKQYSTLIIGPDWTQNALNGLSWIPKVDYYQLVNIYNSSKIALGLSREYDLANSMFSIQASTPAPRIFELAALGIPQAIYFDRPDILQYFERDELILFDSYDSFETNIDAYLSNMSSLNLTDLSARARSKVLSRHLYRHRINDLISFAVSRYEN